MTRPTFDPDQAGYLPNGRPTAERLLADAEERLTLAERLPRAMSAINGWAENASATVRVTVNSLGELVDLHLDESVLRASPHALSAEILHLAEEATKAATVQAIDDMAAVFGDAEVLDMARAAGLDDRLDSDAPVVPWREVAPPRTASTGSVDTPADDETGPVSSSVIARAEPTGAPSRDWQHEQEDLSTFDFTQFRSDR